LTDRRTAQQPTPATAAVPSTRILVAGDSTFAQLAAEELVQEGIPVVLAVSRRLAPEQRPIAVESGPELTRLEGTQIVSCKGSIGNFQVVFSGGRRKRRERFSLVFLSPETLRRADYRFYGLEPSESVLPLSRVSGMPDDAETKAFYRSMSGKEGACIVLLVGMAREGNPVIMAEAMKAAMDLQQATGARCYMLSNNIKVAARGIEELYYDSRLAGVTYFKPADGLPAITVENGNVKSISFRDDTTQESIVLEPDRVILGENIVPGPQFSAFAQVFGLDTDDAGFLQTGNAHRWPIHTNRPGIYAVGPARQPQTEACRELDIKSSIVALQLFRQAPAVHKTEDLPRIEPDRCIHCLTCYRICPYRAIDFVDGNPTITDACQGCFLCSAECPREAITLRKEAKEALSGELTGHPSAAMENRFAPRLTLFACRRSAMPAAETAVLTSCPVTSAIECHAVPCAGSIRVDQVLAAFSAGTDGVLLLSCHDGNCHSENGSRHARRRIEDFRRLLPLMGVSPQRLSIQSLAANMGAEFSRCLSEFEASIRSLGPVRKGQPDV